MYIGISAGGTPLRLKRGAVLDVMMPKLTGAEMELFYGQRNPDGRVDWVQAGKPFKAFTTESAADAPLEAALQQELDSYKVKVAVPKYKDEVVADMEPGPDGRRKSVELDKVQGGAGNLVLKEVNGRMALVRSVADTVNQQYREEWRQGTAAQRLTDRIYETMQLQQLGWINCDRFFRQPMVALNAALDTAVHLQVAQAYLLFDELNSVMSFNLDPSAGKQKLAEVPAGRGLRIVAIGWAGKQPYVSTQHLSVGAGTTVVLQMQPTTEAEITRLIAMK